MTLRIGINGFGRIGRAVTRILQDKDGFELVGINDLTDPGQLAHSLKYDSIFGRFPKRVSVNGNFIHIGDWKARVSAERDPAHIDWESLQVDFVLDSTGIFRTRSALAKHLEAGAQRVILSVPPKDALDATVVLGVNCNSLTGEEQIVSNASCTTNAAAPLTKVIHDAFRIKRGFINTIHAYTNDQRLMDFPHSDWRRSRAAALNVIPTTTGAAKAVGNVIPALRGKLDGMAYRVPVPDGSVVDMIVEVEKTITAADLNDEVLRASQNELKGILEYCSDPIVSSDILGNPHSSIFDSALTQVMDNHLVKVVAWYDNEWGYSNRLIDLMEKLGS